MQQSRRVPRYNTSVVLYLYESNTKHMALLYQIALLGFGCSSDSAFAVGSEITASIQMAYEEKNKLKSVSVREKGIIRWRAKNGGPGPNYRYGIEFINPATESILKLETVITHLKVKSSDLSGIDRLDDIQGTG